MFNLLFEQLQNAYQQQQNSTVSSASFTASIESDIDVEHTRVSSTPRDLATTKALENTPRGLSGHALSASAISFVSGACTMNSSNLVTTDSSLRLVNGVRLDPTQRALMQDWTEGSGHGEVIVCDGAPGTGQTMLLVEAVCQIYENFQFRQFFVLFSEF